jgi:hypothetical protein
MATPYNADDSFLGRDRQGIQRDSHMLNQADLVLGIVQKLSLIIAAVMGLIWFKLRYTKKDWHVHSRLKLNIDGEIVNIHGISYILIKTDLENVGLTGHRISHNEKNDTYICIYYSEMPQGANTVLEIHWSDVTYFDVFEKHTWLSPGEVVKEQHLIAIPETDVLAVKLEVGVITNGSQRPWKDEKIIFRELTSPSQIVRNVLQRPEGAPA